MSYNGDGMIMKRPRVTDSNRFGGGPYSLNRTNGPGEVVEKPPNHVLLLTVVNPVYPITVDVINTICSPNGKVQRIVIFKKFGVQAMVEFDSLESAVKAKDALDGADIYSGCCTLKIDYAKPTKLNVKKNDSESWDYTVSNVKDEQNSPARKALLQAPRFTGETPQLYDGRDGGGNYGGAPGGPMGAPMRGGGGGPMNHFGGGGGGAVGGQRGGMMNYDDQYGLGPDDFFNDGFQNGRGGGGGPRMAPGRPQFNTGMMNQGGRGGRGGGGFGGGFGGNQQMNPGFGPGMGQNQEPGGIAQSSVIMAYGMDHEKMNCQKVFNLFCLYGNVVRVKFLRTIEGGAMIQMGDPAAVERTIQNLNYISVFDSKMQLGYSKQAFLADVHNPYELPDGSPSFKDFMGNRQNRFMNPKMAAKNKINRPAKVLHFYNVSATTTEEEISEIFNKAGIRVKKVKAFPSRDEKTRTGLIEFTNLLDAVEGVATCNHTEIPNPDGKYPFMLKLCFSTSPFIREFQSRGEEME